MIVCRCDREWRSAPAFAAHCRTFTSCRWSADEIFDRSIEIVGECWIWRGASKLSGWTGQSYGRLSWHGRKWAAHRWSFVVLGGREIPPGFELDHLCPSTLCVRPEHLEAVSPEEHERRTDEKRRPLPDLPVPF